MTTLYYAQGVPYFSPDKIILPITAVWARIMEHPGWSELLLIFFILRTNCLPGIQTYFDK